MLHKIIILALVVLLQAASAVRQSASNLVLRDCDVQHVQGKAKCGTLQVYENRATKKGRMIGLNILILPATGDKREPDPIVYFAGGPGSAATEEGPGLAQAFPQLHEHRDLLLVDQRGTGGSNPLNCDLYDPADLQSYLGYFFSSRCAWSRRTRGHRLYRSTDDGVYRAWYGQRPRYHLLAEHPQKGFRHGITRNESM